MPSKNIVFLGPNGSGKSTQGNILTKRFVAKFISAGDLLRREVADETEFGLWYKDAMARGEFAPSDVVNNLMLNELKYSSTPINILDGFPRNQEQLEIAEKNITIDLCVYFSLDDTDEILKRSLDRGRADDTEEVINKRLGIFKEVTYPVIEHYKNQGKLRILDAAGSVEEVSKRLITLLGL